MDNSKNDKSSWGIKIGLFVIILCVIFFIISSTSIISDDGDFVNLGKLIANDWVEFGIIMFFLIILYLVINFVPKIYSKFEDKNVIITNQNKNKDDVISLFNNDDSIIIKKDDNNIMQDDNLNNSYNVDVISPDDLINQEKNNSLDNIDIFDSDSIIKKKRRDFDDKQMNDVLEELFNVFKNLIKNYQLNNYPEIYKYATKNVVEFHLNELKVFENFEKIVLKESHFIENTRKNISVEFILEYNGCRYTFDIRYKCFTSKHIVSFIKLIFKEEI